jgi:ferredoxin--NADP+ reductase
VDEATGTVYKGVCSGYLCDLEVGSKTLVTGPVGKAFIMPPVADANLIMIATGTGIAPFRAFLHNRYNTVHNRSGKSWLFFGAQTHKDFLYQEELKVYQQQPDFQLTTAFSREEKTAEGQRMYVQHRIAEHAAAVFELLKAPNTYLYICGLKGMEVGILEALEQAAEAVGQSWPELLSTLKAEKRWLLEVY